MSGTITGGKKAALKNKAKDPDYYANIGAKGGKAGHTGGFADKTICGCNVLPYEHIKAECAGKKGGTISRRH